MNKGTADMSMQETQAFPTSNQDDLEDDEAEDGHADAGDAAFGAINEDDLEDGETTRTATWMLRRRKRSVP